MHRVIKNIIKKHSVFAVIGVILQLGAIVCLVKAITGTTKEIHTTVNAALDDYATRNGKA